MITLAPSRNLVEGHPVTDSVTRTVNCEGVGRWRQLVGGATPVGHPGRPRPRRASGLLVSSRVGARLLPPIIVFDPAWAYLALGLARPCGFWVAGLVRVWSAFAPRRSLYGYLGSRLAATCGNRMGHGASPVARPSPFSPPRGAVMSHVRYRAAEERRRGSRRETITINHKRLQPVRSPNSPNTGSDVERPKHDARARARAQCAL